MLSRLIAALLLLAMPLCFLVAGQPPPVLVPYAMEWRPAPEALIDLSFMLDAPAGKHGFIRARDGHLATGDGRRFRIWGVNFTAASTMPAKQDAAAVATHLARFGFNCVRFHFLDRLAPDGLIDASRDDTRALDGGQLDKLDFFIAALKKAGIYTDLNLNVGRTYKAGDRVRDYELLGYAKGLTYFDPRLLELQREYAAQLLTHRNPYTGLSYVEDPAVALIELVNENSIVELWFSGMMRGRNTLPHPGTWTDIPASYEQQLTALYHAWLTRRGMPVVPRLSPDEFKSAPQERFRTEARFYSELEDAYFQSMLKYLRDDLKTKPLIAATSDHNHSGSGYPLLRSASKLDVVDAHDYWQHPRFITDPATQRITSWDIPNTAMVDNPLSSTVVELARSAVAGKPFIVSELNHPFPNEYASEGIPIVAAYAGLQNWDGVFWYTFEHKSSPEWTPKQPSFFELSADPVKRTEMAAGALAFLRGSVGPARQTVTRSYSADDVYESIRLPKSERPYFTPGFPRSLALRHGIRIAGFDGPSTREFPAEVPEPYASDTEQLSWRTGLVVVASERFNAQIGDCRRRETRGVLRTRLTNAFCSVTLSSLDDAPLARARRMLLTTGARVANTAMRWNAERTSLVDWGTAPTQIEPVTGFVSLAGLEAARRVEAIALDSQARPLRPPVVATRQGAEWVFAVGEPGSPWYLIRIFRDGRGTGAASR